MSEYRGVNNVARKVVQIHRGVNNVARHITKEYRGVSNVARLVFEQFPHKFQVATSWSSVITLNDYYSGADGDTWRLMINYTATSNTSSGRVYTAVRIKGGSGIGGKTMTMACTCDASGSYSTGYIHCRDDSDNLLKTQYISADGTYTVEIPSSATIIYIGVDGGTSGTHEHTLTITSLTIGDTTLV